MCDVSSVFLLNTMLRVKLDTVSNEYGNLSSQLTNNKSIVVEALVSCAVTVSGYTQ